MARANPKAPRRPRGEARLTPRQRLSWLRLIRSENVGPATFRALVNEFGGAEAAIAALPLLSRRGGRAHDIRLCTEAEAEAEFAAAESLGADLVAIGEPGYPPALAQVDAPPPLLYAKGKLDLADIPIVSIVGARNGSAVGNSPEASPPSWGSRVSSSPRVLPAASIPQPILPRLSGGRSPCSPAASTSSTHPENKGLQRAIGERGLLISERSPGFSPRAKDFPRRNRLISGIALGVIVVEGAERSDSLATLINRRGKASGRCGRPVSALQASWRVNSGASLDGPTLPAGGRAPDPAIPFCLVSRRSVPRSASESLNPAVVAAPKTQLGLTALGCFS